MSTAFRLGRAFIGALLAGLLAGAILLVMVPVALGWRPYTILTGSMRPNVQPGDIVMDRPIAATTIHVGDVVTFTDPTRQGKLVTHRVRSIAHGREVTAVETRGDANTTSERWSVPTDGRVGRVVYVIPKVGHFANLVRSPAGVLLLIVIPVLGLGFLALRSIWRDEDDDRDETDHPEDAESTPPQDDGPADAEPPGATPGEVPDAAAGPGR